MMMRPRLVMCSARWWNELETLVTRPGEIFSSSRSSRFRCTVVEPGGMNVRTSSSNVTSPTGIREIKAFTREEAEAAHVTEHINRYRDSMLKALRLMATFRPFVEFVSSLGGCRERRGVFWDGWCTCDGNEAFGHFALRLSREGEQSAGEKRLV